MAPPFASLPYARRLAWRGAAVALLVMAGIGLWPSVVAWQQTQLAQRLAAQALQYEDGRSEASIARLVELGTPGIASLVRLAASSGPFAAPTARRALLDELAERELAADPGDLSGLLDYLTPLAPELASHAERFDARGQRWAQRLSRQIARQCDRLTARDAAPLLAACGRILDAPAAVALPGRLTSQWFQEWDRWRTRVAATPRSSPSIEAEAPELAKPQAARATPPPIEASAAVVPAPATELWMTPSGDERPAEIEISAEQMAAPAPLESLVGRNADMLIDVPGPDEVWRNLRRFRELTDRELVRQLDSAPLFEGLALRRILWERGLSERELELIRELESQPPADRRDGLDRISSLPPAPARHVLRWFVTDLDAATRLKALTLLATTGDPQLADLARERAVNDADPRVAELAQRILREQR